MSGTLAEIVVIGRLTRDAELKYTPSGSAICHFSIATDHREKKGGQWVETANFRDVDLWGKQGESINQYLTKGKSVAVVGSEYIQQWESDGVKHLKVCINANNVTFVGSKQESNASQNKPNPSASSQASIVSGTFEDDVPF